MRKEFVPITAEEHFDAFAQTGFRVVELFWFSQMQAGFYAIK
jgi:tRNA (cmo5U34)-methyltransferase